MSAEIRTLADFKRAMTVGRTFNVTNHLHPAVSGSRTVLKVQTNALKFSYVKADGESGANGYTEWPKRDEVRFDGTDVHFLYEPGSERVAFTYHLADEQ